MMRSKKEILAEIKRLDDQIEDAKRGGDAHREQILWVRRNQLKWVLGE